MKRIALTCAALIAAAPAAGQEATLQERQALALSGTLGTAIHLFDRAAWVASDAAMAKFGRERMVGAGGWVIEPGPDGSLLVTFYRGESDSEVAFFEVAVAKGKVTSSRVLPDGTRLTGAQRAQAAARDAAVREAVARKFLPCTRAPFNSVVLPSAGPDGSTLVYLLSAQVENGSYPVGGHYRLTVDADGSVRDARPFTKSCLQVGAPPDAEGEPAGLVVSHLLDPVPTEMHVFTSFTAGLPLYVLTGERLWQVQGSKIVPVKR